MEKEGAAVHPRTKIVRISFSDPDATDDSSDDEYFDAVPKKKSNKKIHLRLEIAQSFAEHSVPKQSTESAPPPPPPSAGKLKLTGVHMRKSRRFSAEIRDPFKKRRCWLGTFVTPEEASEAYLSRKRKIEEMMAGEKRKRGSVRVAISKKSSPGDSSICGVQNGSPELLRETGGGAAEEEIRVGEKKLAEEDDDEESKFGFWNGVKVVDKNGFLLGEFSKIDDLSLDWGFDDDDANELRSNRIECPDDSASCCKESKIFPEKFWKGWRCL